MKQFQLTEFPPDIEAMDNCIRALERARKQFFILSAWELFVPALSKGSILGEGLPALFLLCGYSLILICTIVFHSTKYA
jgi:hypothetical protein